MVWLLNRKKSFELLVIYRSTLVKDTTKMCVELILAYLTAIVTFSMILGTRKPPVRVLLGSIFKPLCAVLMPTGSRFESCRPRFLNLFCCFQKILTKFQHWQTQRCTIQPELGVRSILGWWRLGDDAILQPVRGGEWFL